MSPQAKRQRIVSMTMGTVGDLKMFLSLNIALKAAGYDVCLAAPENFHGEIRAAGLEAVRCGGDFHALMQTNAMRRFVRHMVPWFMAAMAVAYGGLSKEDALRALTVWPAEIWGVADRIGSIEVGKEANLFVATGDPLEIRTEVKQMYIAGRQVSLTSRRTQFYEEYKDRTP